MYQMADALSQFLQVSWDIKNSEAWLRDSKWIRKGQGGQLQEEHRMNARPERILCYLISLLPYCSLDEHMEEDNTHRASGETKIKSLNKCQHTKHISCWIFAREQKNHSVVDVTTTWALIIPEPLIQLLRVHCQTVSPVHVISKLCSS